MAEPTPPRILVVEDDDDTRRAMGIRLQRSGFETLEAIDTSSAVEAARRTRPDAILLDLGLPGGGGLVVLQQLSENPGLGRLPVIVLSARDAHTAREQAFAAGACAYLEKLVTPAILVDTIRSALSVQDTGPA